MQFVGDVGFKSSAFTVMCYSFGFVDQQLKTFLTLCVLCGLSHLSQIITLGPRSFKQLFREVDVLYLKCHRKYYNESASENTDLVIFCDP